MEQNSGGFQQHFNLKWNNHTNNFLQVFAEHQNQEALVDVTLTCEGHYISAHKLVLSACSDYFRTIFKIQPTVQHPVIFLNGIRFKDLKYILNFMYLGEVKVLESDLPFVLALGESLQVKGLSAVKLVENNEPKSETKVKDNAVNTTNIGNENILKSSSENDKVLNLTKTVPKQENIISTPLSTPHGSLVPNTQRTKLMIPSVNENSENHPPLKKIMLVKPKASTSTSPKPQENLNEPVERNKTKINEMVVESNSRESLHSSIQGPPNAFMIFIKEQRDKLMAEHPEKDSKNISMILSDKWKSLGFSAKQVYMEAAKKAEEEHKSKYPNYHPPLKRKRHEDINTNNLTPDTERKSIINISDDD